MGPESPRALNRSFGVSTVRLDHSLPAFGSVDSPKFVASAAEFEHQVDFAMASRLGARDIRDPVASSSGDQRLKEKILLLVRLR